MLRRTAVVSLLSILATPCFSGFYLGASVGPEGASFSQKAHFVAPDPAHPVDAVDVVDKNHFSGLGVFGSLFAGYGWTRDRYYLAIEGNANLSSVQHKYSNDEYIHHNTSKTTFTIRNSEGVSALPGFFLSKDTLFYGRVGYINGRLQINESDPTIRSMTKNRNGIRYGLGLRHDLDERWTLMLDYSQINYDSVNGTVVATRADLPNVTKQTKITPSTAQMGLGILYNFDVPQKVFVK